MSVQSPTLAELIAAEAVIERAETMGRTFRPGTVEKARLIVRNAAERDAREARKRLEDSAS
ncbi:MAG TPA: hypothetical protein PLZ93_24830 [Nocardioides sp.]|uniref:hypothetical protein n=1 Tax=uncultured Nocardioides sp. TaxID=198441 RepID=UPI000EE11441|nr:hypothetical protein [uncultured Nocardioides sp.]HCB04662.1 hypothetical protein [Nocardioides sp.]HRD63088.1 hypothetical protein [Nocardioides sp.]HRI98875.1 hypothetical protein [Nocardioides sp.]HRK48778.1 hypothetical protein [Nocardioides sp.]